MQAFRTRIIKINCANLRNVTNSCIRLTSDVTAAKPPSANADTPALSEVEEVTLSSSPLPSPSPAVEAAVVAPADHSAVLESATTAAINVAARYNVVAERTFGGFSKPLSIAELNHKMGDNNNKQHLQPCKMREFYSGREREQVVQFPRNIDPKDMTFAESKTRANLTLPLKPVKLASPFPEPVKVMMSNTTSDEEKAQQMLAESKSQKMSASDWDRPQTPFARRNYSTLYNNIVMKSNNRYYTTTTQPLCAKKSKKKKCKLVEGKRICPNMILKNCPGRARQSCDEGERDWRCKKQDSPYPAYSEFCHEDVIEKPSECKMCPWPSEKHPTFRAPKRKLHTLKPLSSRRTGLEMLDDRIKAVKAEAAALSEAARALQASDDIFPLDEAKTSDDDAMHCDLRKPACKRPPPSPCGEKKKEKRKHKRAPKKKKKCDSVAATAQPAEAEELELMAAEDNLDHMLPDSRLIDGLGSEHAIEAAKKNNKKNYPERKRGKCQKWPFRPFDSPKRSHREKTHGGCPVKPKPPLVRDCPPEDKNMDCAGAEASAATAEVDAAPVPMSSTPNPYKMEYLMKKKKKDKKRCPKVDLNMNRTKDDDRCKKPYKPHPPCPNNLLPIKKRIKRPRPTKKTQDNSVTSIPVDMTSEQTQHERPKM